jgi:hypothetical protein
VAEQLLASQEGLIFIELVKVEEGVTHPAGAHGPLQITEYSFCLNELQYG